MGISDGGLVWARNTFFQLSVWKGLECSQSVCQQGAVVLMVVCEAVLCQVYAVMVI